MQEIIEAFLEIVFELFGERIEDKIHEVPNKALRILIWILIIFSIVAFLSRCPIYGITGLQRDDNNKRTMAFCVS